MDQTAEVPPHASVQQGDVLTVWRLDRLGRTMRHLIETVTDLAQRGIGFQSITESMDTTTGGGELLFHVMGAFGAVFSSRNPAAGPMHAADLRSPNRRRTALQPAPLRSGAAPRRLVHIHGRVLTPKILEKSEPSVPAGRIAQINALDLGPPGGRKTAPHRARGRGCSHQGGCRKPGWSARRGPFDPRPTLFPSRRARLCRFSDPFHQQQIHPKAPRQHQRCVWAIFAALA